MNKDLFGFIRSATDTELAQIAVRLAASNPAAFRKAMRVPGSTLIGGLWFSAADKAAILAAGTEKIARIKAVRNIKGLGLRESKDMVESREFLGVFPEVRQCST